PRLVAWDHRAEAATAAERLAGKRKYPAFSLGLNYIQTGAARMDGVPDSGTDAVTASLAFSLPIWRGKYDAASREAAGHYRSARASRNELANQLIAELERALFEYRDAGRKWDLYATTLLPKARQSLGAVRAAYEAGESGFLDVIDAERLLLEFELSRARALSDALIQQADVERLAAMPFPGSGSQDHHR
ncbi:TolC family protein, partial [bacterium]|nr:TolC family protein [bacterium]